jgi:trimethylamine--corrinoid protein Co-methyltransferase
MQPFNVLDPQEIESIHQATLRVLMECGVILSHPRTRQILQDHGAILEDRFVRFPPEMVERAISTASGEVSLRGRSGAAQTLHDGSLHWHNLGGARDIFDHRLQQRRPATLQDLQHATLLLDAIESATSITPLFTPSDVAGELMSLAMYRHTLPFTTKPVQGPGVQNATEVIYAIRMAEVLGPPPQTLSLSVSPVSPLTFPDDAVEAIIEIARHNIPFGPLPCPTAGTTAPFSLAGALVQQNAEVLASLVLAQSIQPGLPIIYCGRLAMMEPRTAISVWGGVELGLVSAATVQIGHRYGLPVNVYGFSTNSHTLDLQNGSERALNAILPALAGADELSGIGEMEAGVLSSFAQIIADDEIAASVRRARAGFSTDEQALAVEVILSVMKGSHNFLAQKHTRQYMRGGEVLLTSLADRCPWEIWERERRHQMADRAQARAEYILASHQVPPLDPQQEKALEEIMQAAQLELA